MLRVIALHEPAYKERITFEEYGNGTIKLTEGMCLNLLIALQYRMNFNYTPVKGKGWKAFFPNGTYDGMVGQLVYNEADISIAQAGMIFMIDVLGGVSMLHATAKGQFVAIFKQPISPTNFLVSEFSTMSWIVYFGIWVLIFIFINLNSFIDTHITSNGVKFNKDIIGGTFVWVVATICCKGWNVQVNKAYMRGLYLFVTMIAYCIYAVYSSQITVFLVNEQVPIKNFENLKDSSMDVFSDADFGAMRRFLDAVNDRREIKLPKENANIFNIEYGISALFSRNTEMAFIAAEEGITSVYHSRFSLLTDALFCQTITLVPTRSDVALGMFVKKGSPYRETFNVNILRLGELGILARINSHYDLATRIACLKEIKQYRGGIRLRHIWFPFIVLLGGFLVCLLISVYEWCLTARM